MSYAVFKNNTKNEKIIHFRRVKIEKLFKIFFIYNKKEQKVPNERRIKMKRQEVIDFLHKNYHCRKGKVKTIKELTEGAKYFGYKLIKNGVDNYDLYENGVIIDFTKPLKIKREIPDLAKNKAYNGVPLILFLDWMYVGAGFNPELWCYIMNKKDNDYISFEEIKNLEIMNCKSNEKIVRQFDYLAHFGYIKEKEDCIEFYAYPSPERLEVPTKMLDCEVERQAPYIIR